MTSGSVFSKVSPSYSKRHSCPKQYGSFRMIWKKGLGRRNVSAARAFCPDNGSPALSPAVKSDRSAISKWEVTTESVWLSRYWLPVQYMERKRVQWNRVKNEARILGKVILDTWRFILGYIAKYRWILFRGSFPLSFPEFTESGKDSAYLGSAKRKTSPPQRGRERQLEQCESKASDNGFSMTSTSPSSVSVYEEEKTRLQTRKIPL